MKDQGLCYLPTSWAFHVFSTLIRKKDTEKNVELMIFFKYNPSKDNNLAIKGGSGYWIAKIWQCFQQSSVWAGGAACLITEVDQLEQRLRRRERKTARNFKQIIEEVNKLGPQKLDYWLDRKTTLIIELEQENEKIKKQKNILELIKKQT